MREEMLQLAKNVPGLAGVFVDTSGQLTVAVRDTGEASRKNARITVAAFASAHGSRENARSGVRLQKAEVTYAFLDSLLQRVLLGERRNSASLWSVGIDEQSNRILVRVSSKSEADALRADFSDFDRRFIDVIVTAAPTPGQTAYLRARRRPLDNAFAVVANGMLGGTCSIGYLAYRYDFDPNSPDPSLGSYLLTASHCGNTTTSLDSDFPAYQPGTSFVTTDSVGAEFADAQGYVGTGVIQPSCFSSAPAQNCACPTGLWCADADAMLIRLAPSVAFAYGRVTIADNWSGGQLTAPGPAAIRFASLSSSASDTPIIGSTVTKVGQRTGQAGGRVRFNCVYVRVPHASLPAGFTSVGFPCQVEVDGRMGAGDSGGPVWQHQNGWSQPPTPLGILHSFLSNFRDPVGTGSTYWFSTLSRSRRAIGVNFRVN
jgi:hypothetical protein